MVVRRLGRGKYAAARRGAAHIGALVEYREREVAFTNLSE